jgi:hypothetical protein
MSYWKTTAEAAGEQVRRALSLPLALLVGRGEDEPPERPHVFTIVDEYGVEREVYAPPGRVTRWP